MKLKTLLPIGLLCFSMSLVGCRNKNETNTQNKDITNTTTEPNSSISNRINNLFGTDGKNYNYNNENYYNDKNYYNNKNHYNNKNYSNNKNDRFGFGMHGAENIKGNENKSNVIKDSKKIGNDVIRGTEKIGNDIMNGTRRMENDWNKMKNSMTN